MEAKLSKLKGFLVIFEDPVFFQSFKHLGCCIASFRVSFRSSLRGFLGPSARWENIA